jgi:hypothetical protein
MHQHQLAVAMIQGDSMRAVQTIRRCELIDAPGVVHVSYYLEQQRGIEPVRRTYWLACAPTVPHRPHNVRRNYRTVTCVLCIVSGQATR